jgi:two-component system sensor histidine kinase KdpD
MLHGNVYPMDRVPQALTNFFRTDNLIALRELALRFLADETDDQLLEHLQQQGSPAVWGTAERILAAVTGAPGTDGLLRRAARIAARVKPGAGAGPHGPRMKARPGRMGPVNAAIACRRRGVA